MMTLEQVLDFLVDVEMNPKLVLTIKTGNKLYDETILRIVKFYLTDGYATRKDFVESLDVMRRNAFRTNWK